MAVEDAAAAVAVEEIPTTEVAAVEVGEGTETTAAKSNTNYVPKINFKVGCKIIEESIVELKAMPSTALPERTTAESKQSLTNVVN